MRRSLCPTLAFLVACAPALAGGISWRTTDLERAKKEAQAASKPLAIDFYATWCAPCQAMDQTTYKDLAIRRLAQKLVMVKLDAESDEGAPLAKQYQIGSYPTLVFLKPDGQEIDRFTGYKTGKELMPYLAGAIEGKSVFLGLQKRLEVEPDNSELLFEVANGFVLRVDETRATKYLDMMEKADPDNSKGQLEAAYLSRSDLYRRKQDWQAAAAALETLVAKAPKLDAQRAVLTDMAKYFVKAGNTDKAVAAYHALTEKFPTAASYNAMAWELSQKKLALDEAEAAGKKAVELSKQDPGMMDTLAEVYFAQGRFDDAIALAKKELEAKPRDAYFGKQLKKYENAKAGGT